MTHAATKWWLLGGALLVVGLGIVLFAGYRAGTFVIFGQTASRQAQPIATPTDTVSVTSVGTCWTYTSEADQQFRSMSLERCKTSTNWVGWWPIATKPYSSLGQYNPDPAVFDWADTDGVCLLPAGVTEFTNLYECITDFAAEPNQWRGHYSVIEILNPDLATTPRQSTPPLITTTNTAIQTSPIVGVEQTVGWCFGQTSQAGYASRRLRSECQELYEIYEADGDPQTLVSSWCAVTSLPNTCSEPPFSSSN